MELRVIAEGLEFPEGPVWMADGTVLCVELKRRSVVRVHPDGRVETVAIPGGSPNGLAIGPDGAAYVANSGGWSFEEVLGLTVSEMYQPPDYEGGRIERVDLDTGRVDVLYTDCDAHPLVGPNDLVVDVDGGIWFTDFGKWRARERTHGGVYYCAPDGSSIREVIYPLDEPNGIGLSPEGTRLYVAETHTGRLWAWTITGPGEVDRSNPLGADGGELVHGLPGFQLLDSLAVEESGNVVVATLVTGGLSVFSPGGDLVEQVATGDPVTSNVCFGGPERRTAFVTLSGSGRLAALDWPRPGLALEFGA